MLILAQQISIQPASELDAVAPYLFFAFAALVCLSAWAVVITQNIVHMAVYLLLTLGGVAGFYFMLNAEFLAAIQLIVYAGGTLILIVFGVMLTSKNPFLQLRVQNWEIFAGVGVGLLIMILLIYAVVSTSLGGGHELAASGYDHVALIGKALLSAYLVPFEVAAVLLLVVMIGAAFMARRRAGGE